MKVNTLSYNTSHTYVVIALSILTILGSCISKDTFYHKYVSIDGEEWNIADSMHFEIDSLAEGREYATILEFRTNARYPYRNISFVMEQRLRKSHTKTVKTIAYDVTDSNGRKNGEGITYRTHSIPFCTMSIPAGDTIDIFVRHNMQDNILPGITDVGILIETQ